jgi:hypothetical protein
LDDEDLAPELEADSGPDLALLDDRESGRLLSLHNVLKAQLEAQRARHSLLARARFDLEGVAHLEEGDVGLGHALVDGLGAKRDPPPAREAGPLPEEERHARLVAEQALLADVGGVEGPPLDEDLAPFAEAVDLAAEL